MQRTRIEMPDAFPAVVIAIRQFLSSPVRSAKIRNGSGPLLAGRWTLEGASPNETQTNGDSDW